MNFLAANPCFSFRSLLLTAISLSIGWGIRGNYGHELGAMFPGALAAMAICLVSGREDWRRRVAYFAFFGALGWGFGGSMSYMMVIGYTHSGHFSTQLFGFGALFVLGFLWASIGAAATALPAVLDRQSLTDFFKPLSLLFAIWAFKPLSDYWIYKIAQPIGDLDWFDSDWIQVLIVLGGILLYDLLDRRLEKGWLLILLSIAGAGLGSLIYYLLDTLQLISLISSWLLRYYGDTAVYHVDQLSANWPQFILHTHQHLGWSLGLMLGVGIYFYRCGRFRHGSALFLHMALGWWVCFLIFPVLLDLRMTPPRGDNWAGVLGIFLGSLLYFLRHKLGSVAFASIAGGVIGGLGFSGIAWLQLMLIAPGNPALTDDPAVIESWRHWGSANWHSFLEQAYGLVNGIGIFVVLGILAKTVKPLDNSAARQRWTEIFSLMFVLPALSYLNLVKNLNEWTREYAGGYRPFPLSMKAPLLQNIELSTAAWFNLFYFLAACVMLALLIVQRRRPIAIVPNTWLGRGQLLYLLFLWTFIIGNFGKHIPVFSGQRLITEGVVLVNALFVTLLLLTISLEKQWLPASKSIRLNKLLWGSVLAGLLLAVGVPLAETYTARWVFGDKHAGFRGQDYRFGPQANKPRVHPAFFRNDTGQVITAIFSGTKIKDQDLAELKGFPHLIEIRLDNTQITDAAIDHLAGLKTLQVISIQGTKITETGEKRLRESLPEIKIQRED